MTRPSPVFEVHEIKTLEQRQIGFFPTRMRGCMKAKNSLLFEVYGVLDRTAEGDSEVRRITSMGPVPQPQKSNVGSVWRTRRTAR